MKHVRIAFSAALPHRARQSLLAGLLLATPALGAPADSPDSWLARKTCNLSNRSSPKGSSDTNCLASFGELAHRAAEAAGKADSPAETIGRLNHWFFEVESFQPTNDLNSADSLLIDRVLGAKKGHCVGLATVYLALAEELHLPMYGVATPKHVFVRWDDGKVRRNIELFQKGQNVSDEDFVREQKIPKESIDQSVFLANLTRKQFLGFVYQNLGVLESQQGNFHKSGKDYARALRLNPKLAAAYYNRGNDELAQKQFKQAIRDYTKALELYPTDVWALQNRGLAWKGLGEKQKAEEDWKRAREIEPGFKVPE